MEVISNVMLFKPQLKKEGSSFPLLKSIPINRYIHVKHGTQSLREGFKINVYQSIISH